MKCIYKIWIGRINCLYRTFNFLKNKKIINDNFNYIEFEFLDEKNNKIEMTDYFSISVCIH